MAAFDERAGFLEFDGGLPRQQAEHQAFADIKAQLGPPPREVRDALFRRNGTLDFNYAESRQETRNRFRRAKVATVTALPSYPLALEWFKNFRRLSPAPDPCPGFSRGQWARVRAAAVAFLAHHAEAAAGMGWTTLELFGVHETVGVRRVDCCGALMVSNGSAVVEIAPDMIRYANDLKYRRSPPHGPCVPVWEFKAEKPPAPPEPAPSPPPPADMPFPEPEPRPARTRALCPVLPSAAR